jgi:hypothetical protein
MIMTDRLAEARSARSTAAAHTRRGRADAQRAEDAYETAARWDHLARQLTKCPGMWSGDYNPGQLEANARSWAKTGDIYLRSSFRSDRYAEFYRHLGARYAGRA